MEKVENIVMHAGQLSEYAEEYVTTSVQQLKLEVAEQAVTFLSKFLSGILSLVFGLCGVIFGGVALAIFLGNILNSFAVSFLIVFGLFILIAVFIFVFNKRLLATPIIESLIGMLFEDQNEINSYE